MSEHWKKSLGEELDKMAEKANNSGGKGVWVYCHKISEFWTSHFFKLKPLNAFKDVERFVEMTKELGV